LNYKETSGFGDFQDKLSKERKHMYYLYWFGKKLCCPWTLCNSHTKRETRVIEGNKLGEKEVADKLITISNMEKLLRIFPPQIKHAPDRIAFCSCNCFITFLTTVDLIKSRFYFFVMVTKYERLAF